VQILPGTPTRKNNMTHSDFGQDVYIRDRFFRGSKSGCCLEAGAQDGESHSNTLLFEEEHEWDRILIEPDPKHMQVLKTRKNGRKYCAPLWDVTGDTVVMNDINKNGWTHIDKYGPKNVEIVHQWNAVTIGINDVLPQYTDLVSLDTEGSEHVIVGAIDFSRFKIAVFLIEAKESREYIGKILKREGYIFYNTIKHDVIYYDPKLIQPKG